MKKNEGGMDPNQQLLGPTDVRDSNASH